jgi:hypothetical protein
MFTAPSKDRRVLYSSLFVILCICFKWNEAASFYGFSQSVFYLDTGKNFASKAMWDRRRFML